MASLEQQDNAQFDLQNFSAFDRKMESLNTSKENYEVSYRNQAKQIDENNFSKHKNSLIAKVYTDQDQTKT